MNFTLYRQIPIFRSYSTFRYLTGRSTVTVTPSITKLCSRGGDSYGAAPCISDLSYVVPRLVALSPNFCYTGTGQQSPLRTYLVCGVLSGEW